MPLPRTLVFDEIDIGIGGRAAEAVGKKLKTLSQGTAGVVYHASAADCGVCRPALPDPEVGEAWADADGIIRMEDGERTREIARMLSGAKLTETSLKHAEQLLATSR